MAASKLRQVRFGPRLGMAWAMLCSPGIVSLAEAADQPGAAVEAPNSASPVDPVPSLLEDETGLLAPVDTTGGVQSVAATLAELARIGPNGTELETTATGQKAGWDVTGALQIGSELQTGADNGTGGGLQFLGTIMPSITVTAHSQRVDAYILYDPTALFYAGGGSSSGDNSDRVSQAFNGQISANLIPRALGIDLSGFATETSRFGGFRQQATSPVLSDAALQTYSFSARPYVVHDFGTAATGEAEFVLGDTFQNSPDLGPGVAGLSPGQAQALNEIANTNLLSESVRGSLQTGPDFGRAKAILSGQATSLDGSGVLKNAHRDDVSVEGDYALTHKITVLTRVGYEDVHYAGTNPLTIRDAIWSVGVRYHPSATSSVMVRYGHHDGFDSVSANATLRLTERLTVFARSSAALSTELEDIEDTVDDDETATAASGTSAQASTPAPTPNGFAGAQSGLYRLTRLSAGAQLYYERDAFALTFERESRRLVSAASALVQTLNYNSSNDAISGSASWTHLFSPSWTGTALVSYGVIDGRPAYLGSLSNSSFLTATAQATDQLSPTLSLSLSYSYSNSGTPGTLAQVPAVAQNSFLVTLRKTF